MTKCNDVIVLALLLFPIIKAYPDIPGSCDGTFGSAHLPRENTGDGGFRVRFLALGFPMLRGAEWGSRCNASYEQRKAI